MEEGKVSPDWRILLFTYFSLEEGGEGAVEVTVGLEQTVGLGWDVAWKKNSQEECAITYSRPVEPLCRLTFLYSFTVDSPAFGFPLGGSAPRLVCWLLKQNHHNTCQLCFLHALWQIFFFFSISCFITVCQTGEPLKFFTDLTFIRACRSWGVENGVDATHHNILFCTQLTHPPCLCLKRFLTWCFYTWPAFQMREWHLLS